MVSWLCELRRGGLGRVSLSGEPERGGLERGGLERGELEREPRGEADSGAVRELRSAGIDVWMARNGTEGSRSECATTLGEYPTVTRLSQAVSNHETTVGDTVQGGEISHVRGTNKQSDAAKTESGPQVTAGVIVERGVY